MRTPIISVLTSLFAAFLLVACNNERTAAAPAQAQQRLCPPSNETERIFQGLSPHCAGCHSTGARGFFASTAAFQNLIVADPRMVTAGDGANSELVKLLRGTSTSGAFAQMPIGEQTYQQLVDAGTATLPIADVEAWIDGLGQVGRDPNPSPHSLTVRRIDADRILRNLQLLLGESEDELFVVSQNFNVPTTATGSFDDYVFRSPDAYPGNHYSHQDDHHFGLGGGAITTQTSVDNSPSPTFVNTFVPITQSWCKRSVAKANSVLFEGKVRDVTDDNTRAVLRSWSRRFHGEALSDEDIDDLASTVVMPLAADANAAWSSGCAALLRHPKFIFY
jgi:mono/diheme cytochrome c family protein